MLKLVSVQWLAIGAIVLAAWVIRKALLARPPKLRFPVVGDPKNLNAFEAMNEGVKKYPDSPFVIPVKKPMLVLPMRHFNEVMHRPETEISFNENSHDMFLGSETDMGRISAGALDTIKKDLTRQLTTVVLPGMQKEFNQFFASNFVGGNVNEWQDIELYGRLVRIVAVVSSALFVGRPLCEDENWLNIAMMYTVQLGQVMNDALQWNPMLRPFVARFLPSVRTVKKERKRAEKILEPMIRESLAKYGDVKSADVEAGSSGTILAWLVTRVGADERNLKWLTFYQLGFSFAAVHTTSFTGWSVIMDLASRPEYIKPLRDEMDAAIAEDGWEYLPDGQRLLKKQTVAKLSKLDSFIRESQRLNPLGYLNGVRKVVKKTVLSDGTVLPKGASVSFPLYPVAMSSETEPNSRDLNDKAGNKGPAEFDGFRFSRLREQPGKQHKYQAVTTSEDHFTFGHGPHACPGRFFAIYEIKCLLIELIREWDFKLPDEYDGKRPQPFVIDTSVIPNPTAKLSIRKRPVSEKA